MGSLGPRVACPQQADDKMRKAVPKPELLHFTRALLDMIDHHHLLRETSKTQRPAALAPQAHQSVFRPPGLNLKPGIEPAHPLPVTAWTPGSPQHPAAPRPRTRRGGGGAGRGRGSRAEGPCTVPACPWRCAPVLRGRHATGRGPAGRCWALLPTPHLCPQLAPFLGVCSGCFLLG